MTSDQRRPGAGQGGRIERPRESEQQLDVVGVLGPLGQRHTLERQALLQRRQRDQVGQIGIAGDDPVEAVLIAAGQREV